MSRIVEPVVCCLGESAGGDPTQFVMERLTREAGLDWRFITAELSADQIGLAVAGIRAMNFDGIAFLEPVAASLRPPLDSLAGSVMCSGRITAARRDGLNWLGEDLTGAAITTLLREVVGEASTAGSIVVYGDAATECLIRLADPALASRLYAVVAEENDKPTEVLAHVPSVLTRHEIAQLEMPIGVLIVADRLSSLDASLLNQCRFVDGAVLMTAGSKSGGSSSYNDELVPHLRRLDEQLLTVAALATTFQFWTGHTANFDTIRDCLDEFASW